jgi:tetratricopeptide (TPR) repeat protein
VAVNRLDQDRVDDAATLFAEVYAGRKVALGDDHPDTLGALQNLALAFNRQEEYGKSQTAYREAYEGQCKSLGPDHPDCFRTAMSLGALSAQMGEFGEAEELLLDVVERATRVLGHSDPVALSAIRKTADLYLAMGIPETAVQLCCDWLDLLAEEPASELPDLREVLKLLNVFAWDTVDPARVHGDGDLALALEAARRATTLAPLNAAYHDTLAWAFLANERYEQAARASEKALELAPESEKAEYMGYLGDLRARTKARTQVEPDKDGE